VNFHGERRSNATHPSTTDPEARLARKGPGKEARLCYAGHVQMDHRPGLVVNPRLTQASGNAEPTAALAMAAEIGGQGRITLGADKGYDQKELVRALRQYRVTRTLRKSSTARSTDAALATRATCSASSGASEWKRSSAGSSWSPDYARLVIVESPELVGPSPSRPLPTTWSECVTCCQSPPESIGEPPQPATCNRLTFRPVPISLRQHRETRDHPAFSASC
jgi:DDE family transposase